MFLIRHTQIVQAWGTGETVLDVTRAPIQRRWCLVNTAAFCGILLSRASWAGGLIGGSTVQGKLFSRGPASQALEVPKDCVGRIPSSCSHDTSSWNQSPFQKPTRKGQGGAQRAATTRTTTTLSGLPAATTHSRGRAGRGHIGLLFLSLPDYREALSVARKAECKNRG